MNGADLSRGHLDLATAVFASLVSFFLNLLIPAHAIIAALSPQNFKSGNVGLKFISFEMKLKLYLIDLFAATPPATTKVALFFFVKSLN